MGLPLVDKVLGSLMAFSWLSAVLYGVSLFLYAHYFRTAKNDLVWIRIAIVLALAVDTASTINQGVMIYSYGVTHWGDYDYLATQPATFFVYIVTTGLSAVIIQTYLLVRIWKLKRNIFLLAVLLLCMLTAFGGALATASSIQWVFKSLAQRNNISKFVYIWLISSAGTDVAIALTLCLLLRGIQSDFRSTQQMLRRLTIAAVETGSVTSVLAIIVVAVFAQDVTSNVETGLAFTLGRAYSLTLLLNVLSRKSLLSIAQGGSNGSHHEETMGGRVSLRVFKPSAEEEVRIEPGTTGIHVQKTSAVHFDTALPDNKSQSSTQDFESMHKSLDRLNARRQKQDYSSDEEV